MFEPPMIPHPTIRAVFDSGVSRRWNQEARCGWDAVRNGLLAAFLLATVGCQEPPVITNQGRPTDAQKPTAHTADEHILQSGDSVRVSFPGAQNLDTTQPIRSDGRITLPMISEVIAAGKTPMALGKELEALYAPQLVSKEVSVTVMSTFFHVFVSGAVQRPGKVTTDHPISALEAIMEAGGFDNTKANTAGVVVVRQVDGHTEHFTLNLKQVLEGRRVESFYLRRADIVHVPEKFSWF